MIKLSLALAAAMAFTTFTPVYAAPFNATGNPQIVANYSSGTHGIAGESSTHTGSDVVMQAGNSGNFQQWFTGSTGSSGQTEGDHSLWRLSPNDPCKPGETEVISTPSNFWGSYLQQGVRYCVKTNDFHVSH